MEKTSEQSIVLENKDEPKWYSLSVAETLKNLVSHQKGLTTEQAKERLQKYGRNTLKAEKKISAWGLLFEQFKNILVIILLLAVVLSIVVGLINWVPGTGLPGEITDAIVIFAIVIAVIVLGFIEEFRSGKALEALKKMAAPTATILRDGFEKEIPADELVPGDVVLLTTGDRIPADLRLIEAINLNTQEASLTGESTPVEKSIEAIQGEGIAIGDRVNMAFSGTVVTLGRGLGVVVGTGMRTEFGKIATMLESVTEEQTPLQKSLDKVGRWLGIASLIIVAVIVAVQLIFTTGHSFLEMIIWGISLAVAAVPEALPAVVVISLSIGVQKMARRHALVRRLSAVETLGCTTYICSDKTGTLTQDQMTIRSIYVSGKLIEVKGAGYEPKGEFMADGKQVDIAKDTTARIFLNTGALCNDTHLLQTDGSWHIKGDPTEGALVVLAAKAGVPFENLEMESPRLEEIPFSSERKRMTTVHSQGNEKVAYSKGAVEIILENCSSVSENGQVRVLNQTDKQKILDVARGMAENALRVLGLAYKPVTNVNDKNLWEKDMIFTGMVGMIDPPRPEAKEAIKKCQKAGIKTIMITGDHKVTASAIARELGILQNGIAVTGAELDKMSDAEYEKKVGEIEVYARVSPSHKLKVIEALSKRGEVVAMTGDGVNDAPALKKADIGVAMGVTGTDVSKEAAAMVLTDDNFASIVAAVEEGRVIFGNIKKYLMYLLSSNLGEILLMVLAILLGPVLGFPAGAIPLVAVQLLLVNLITDGLPAIALAFDPADPDIMEQRPRPRDQSIFTRPVVTLMTIGGVWSGLLNLAVFNWAFVNGRSLLEAQSLCFICLVIIQFFKAYNFRSDRQSIFKIGMFRNKWLNYAILSQIILLVAIVEVPAFHGLFNTFPLNWHEWLAIILIAGTIFPVLEISKLIIRKTDKNNGRERHQAS